MKRICHRKLSCLLGLLLICLSLSACRARPLASPKILLDGAVWGGEAVSPDSADDLRVYMTLDGAALIDLPFSEPHRLTIIQPDGEENTVVLTGEAVFMESANCDNQDCVYMGEITRENLEMCVMGGFIICLPHRISVEVRGH